MSNYVYHVVQRPQDHKPNEYDTERAQTVRSFFNADAAFDWVGERNAPLAFTVMRGIDGEE